MDYKAKIKERMSKLLFLEMNKDGFKENIGIPSYVTFKNKDLYLPISSEYISSNINDEIKIKNLPIYYFIEGMFIAIGADENLRFNDDYELILDYIKDTENCIKSLISKRIQEERYLDAYLLLKGYYSYSKDLEVMKKILLVGETIREQDSSFKDILLDDIEYCITNNLKIAEPYLYKAIVLKNEGDFKAARVAINEYINKGGKVTKEVEIINTDIQNISDYENAIELLAEEPAKAVEILLRLAGEFEENPLIYYYLGIAFRKLEDYHKAIYYLKESVKRESGILEVIVELGLNYACINDFEEAIKFFKKAFEASRDVEICTNIVMCYLNINDLENLPIPDNSNEIDINGLKQIISSRDEYRKAKDMGRTITRKRVEEEPREEKRRVYDINVLLETAKNEVNKNNEVEGKKLINANFLTDLDDANVPSNDFVEVSEVTSEKEKEVSNTDSLPLDILVDLKGTDNTVVTDPIVKDEVTMIEKIKDGETFYSGSFNFTKKDFADEEDDDLFEEKSHTGVKVFFLIVGLLLLAGVIYLAITKYVL